ncbi:hypothetical protein RugamoR64_55760 [Duganella rhizosphaerae]|uniref:YcaO-like family protein n=1 Tax=Duganella rhizosphaerae TaxID=2885763 RepID=UPI0030E8E839
MSPMTLCGTHMSLLKKVEMLPPGSFIDSAYHIYSCVSGSTVALHDGASSPFLNPLWGVPMSGAGTDIDAELAQLKAVCETLERYASCVLREGEYRIASAEELGEDAFDWRSLPLLSEAELALPQQIYTNFDPTAPIRWIAAWNLCTGREQAVPLALTHLQPRGWTAERFTYTISTGLAAHTDWRRCIISAICEVIERDAIALNWLLRHPLRRIRFTEEEIASFAPAVQPLLRQEEFAFYDARSDFGLPIVYLHRRRPNHPYAANLVTCAANFDYHAAVANALREMVSMSAGLDTGRIKPRETAAECASIEEGAVFMALPERAAAFDFLGASGATVGLSELLASQPDAGNDAERLQWLLTQARANGHDILISELTPDDLHDAGVRVFRALIPGLMPMTTDMRCRFLASHRLRQMHQHWRIEAPLDEAITPFPQSFA